MTYPDELKLYFDTQLVDTYLIDGPAHSDPSVDAHRVFVARLILRSVPFYGANSENVNLPFNFKITAPSAIKNLNSIGISDIVRVISGQEPGNKIFSDNISVWKAISAINFDPDGRLTPLSLLLEFAGQTIEIEIQGEKYHTTLPVASPNNLSAVLALVQQGYLTFTKQE